LDQEKAGNEEETPGNQGRSRFFVAPGFRRVFRRWARVITNVRSFLRGNLGLEWEKQVAHPTLNPLGYCTGFENQFFSAVDGFGFQPNGFLNPGQDLVRPPLGGCHGVSPKVQFSLEESNFRTVFGKGESTSGSHSPLAKLN
jgi:hypothetical protein